MRLLSLLAIGAMGCTPAGSGASADAQGGADALFGERVGRVVVRTGLDLESARSGTYIQAEIGIEGLPSRHAEERLTEVMRAGDCRLLEEQPAACNPPCAGDWWCLADGTCRYNNYGLDAGMVTIEGLQRLVELRFDQGYVAYDDALLFDPGAWITASAPGGTWSGGTAAGFQLAGVAPEDLDVDIPGGVLSLDDATGATLTWTPSARDDARYSLRVATPHGHAGASDHILACDGPDTGQVVIEPELVAAFPPLQVPNCLGLTCVPVELSRFTRVTSSTLDGTVSLELGATRWFWAEHVE